MDTSGCYDYEMTGPEEPHYDHDHLVEKLEHHSKRQTHGTVKPTYFYRIWVDLVPQYVQRQTKHSNDIQYC